MENIRDREPRFRSPLPLGVDPVGSVRAAGVVREARAYDGGKSAPEAPGGRPDSIRSIRHLATFFSKCSLTTCDLFDSEQIRQ